MNRLNLRRIAQFAAVFQEPSGSTSALQFSGGNKRLYGFAAPPRWTESDQFTADTATLADPTAREFTEAHPAYTHAGRAMATLLRLDRAVAEVGKDRSLSPIGQGEKLKATRADAARQVAIQAGAIRTIRTAHDGRFAAFYDPQAADDLPSLLLDQEIRAHWRSLNDSARTELAASMASTGANDRVALALLRGPIPLADPYAELVTKGWRAAVAKREPAKAAEVAIEAADLDWAEHVVDATRQYVRPLLAPDLEDRVARIEIYKAVRDIAGAPELFGFADHERPQLERRIAAAGG
ncbi:MAG TPA: hypothetical protein VN750_12465 [Steroidobacteraceae bacterium]|nr:hypothetical protein [Steroidobacteraceae bacterium]